MRTLTTIASLFLLIFVDSCGARKLCSCENVLNTAIVTGVSIEALTESTIGIAETPSRAEGNIRLSSIMRSKVEKNDHASVVRPCSIVADAGRGEVGIFGISLESPPAKVGIHFDNVGVDTVL